MEVLFVILIELLITSVEILANECGSLSLFSFYVKQGETATLILESTLKTTQRNWHIKVKDDTTVIYNSSTPEAACKYAEEKYENGYKLYIYHVDASDEGYFSVFCHLPDGRKVWSKWSNNPLSLRSTPNSSRENGCGILIAWQTKVPEGNDFKMSFKSHNGQQNINWQKWDNDQSNFHNITDPEVRECRNELIILKVKGFGTRYTNEETISYRVSCGETFSNVVNITIVHIAPEKPIFMNVRDIHECTKCISAQVSNPVTVKCNSTGGSHQWYFKLFINNKTIHDTVIDRFETKTLTYDFKPTEEDINTEFKCIIQNADAHEALAETAKVLLYVKPSKIEVTGLSVKQNQRSEIQCTTYGGRPQLQPLIFINNNSHHLQIIGNISTGYTYEVRAGINTTFSRRNNNHSVSCCVDLLVDRECTKDIQLLNVSYAPLITISGPENRTVYVGEYADTMCYVDSNPQSKIVWLNGTETLLEIVGNRLPLVFLASSSMKGLHTFTCIASNNIGGIQRKHLHVFVEDRPINERGSSLDRHWTFGIVGVVIGLLVCFIVTMIIVMIRKRRKEQTTGPTTRSHNLQNTESNAVGNIGENPVAYDSLLPKSERNNESVDQEYLQMIVSHPGGDEEEREHVYDN